MLSNSNFLFTDTEIVGKKTGEQIIDDLFNMPNDKTHVEKFLDNNIMDRMLKVVEYDRSNYMPRLEKYFPEETVRKLIDAYDKK